jgi:hypothetical protein
MRWIRTTALFYGRRPAAVALAALLLLVSLALSAHQYDLAAHDDNHVCDICLGSAGLTHALAEPPTDDFVTRADIFVAEGLRATRTTTASQYFQARAPPV